MLPVCGGLLHRVPDGAVDGVAWPHLLLPAGIVHGLLRFCDDIAKCHTHELFKQLTHHRLPFFHQYLWAKELTFVLLVAQQKGLRLGHNANIRQDESAAQHLFAALLLRVDEAGVECKQFAAVTAAQSAIDQLELAQRHEARLVEYARLEKVFEKKRGTCLSTLNIPH